MQNLTHIMSNPTGEVNPPAPAVPDSLAERVRLLIERHDQGNMSAAAHRAGMPVATLDRIVRGVVTNPRRSALQSIAALYGVSIDWLLGGAEPPARLARAEAGAPSVDEALRLWAALVYELRLPPELENAMQELPLALDDFGDLLQVAAVAPTEREALSRLRSAAVIGFREALRLAIAAHGIPAVREAIVARGDAIRLRLSHYVAGLTAPGLAREPLVPPGMLENIGKVTYFGPMFEGSFELKGGVPALTGDESWPLAGGAVDAMKETHRHGQPASDDDLPPHRRPAAPRGTPKKKRRRGAK